MDPPTFALSFSTLHRFKPTNHIPSPPLSPCSPSQTITPPCRSISDISELINNQSIISGDLLHGARFNARPINERRTHFLG